MFSSGLVDEIKKALAERMLNAELDQHLEDEASAGGASGEASGNHRNGYSKNDTSQVEVEISPDRRGTFEPQLIPSAAPSRARQLSASHGTPAAGSVRNFV